MKAILKPRLQIHESDTGLNVSGLPHRAFAQRHRVSLSSLQRWLSEARTKPRDLPAVVFREMPILPSAASAPLPAWAVEIVGPDGTTIRCRNAWPLEDFVLLLFRTSSEFAAGPANFARRVASSMMNSN